MLSFQIEDLVLLGDDVDNYVLHTPVEGLDPPDQRASLYARPGEHGAILSNVLYDSRLVTIRGAIKGSTPAQHETNRRALVEVTRITKDANDFPSLKRIDFTTWAGEEYFFYGHPQRPRYDLDPQCKYSEFEADIIVPDPMIFGAALVTSGQVSRPVGGGVEYPIIYPAIYEASSGGTLVITNQGNAPTWPILTIRGIVTNPFINAQTAGKVFQLTYTTTEATDEIVIDMGQKTIVLNGSGSLLSTKTDDSRWFELEPGDNTISFSTGSSGDSGTLEVEAYSAFVGV